MATSLPEAWRPGRFRPTFRLAVLLGGQPWLPRFSPQIVTVDLGLRRLSSGHLTLLSFAGLPELFLTVPGRRSGIARTTPLLCVPRAGSWLVAGSNWGGPKAPEWVGNLTAAGEAVVGWHGRDVPVVARRLVGLERADAWQEMLAVWPNYAKYAARTGREIPVFELTPRSVPRDVGGVLGPT